MRQIFLLVLLSTAIPCQLMAAESFEELRQSFQRDIQLMKLDNALSQSSANLYISVYDESCSRIADAAAPDALVREMALASALLANCRIAPSIEAQRPALEEVALPYIFDPVYVVNNPERLEPQIRELARRTAEAATVFAPGIFRESLENALFSSLISVVDNPLTPSLKRPFSDLELEEAINLAEEQAALLSENECMSNLLIEHQLPPVDASSMKIIADERLRQSARQAASRGVSLLRSTLESISESCSVAQE